MWRFWVLLEEPAGQGAGGRDDLGAQLVAGGGLAGTEERGDGGGPEALERGGGDPLDLVEVGEALLEDVGEDGVAERAQLATREVQGVARLLAEACGIVQGSSR